MSARTRLERCCGQPTPPELIANLDAYRAEVLTEEAARPVRLRKTGYAVIQPVDGRLLVESFVIVGEECTPHPVDVAEDTTQLVDAVVRHCARLAEQAAADMWSNHHRNCYIREGHLCSCGGAR